MFPDTISPSSGTGFERFEDKLTSSWYALVEPTVMVVVAVPVAPPDAAARLADAADDMIALETPEPFFGVGQFYADFTQTTDDDVIADVHMADRSRAPRKHASLADNGAAGNARHPRHRRVLADADVVRNLDLVVDHTPGANYGI